MGMRTVVLKLHKPGKAKKDIIDKALLDYNKALDFLFEKGTSELPAMTEKYGGKDSRYNAMALSKWIDSDISRELNQYDVQPFKDSLKLEFGIAAESCLRSGNHFPGQAIQSRPIYFCRYDTKRSYCLLYDNTKDRYYAKLYLLNGAHTRAISGVSGYGGRLVHIHRDGSILERSGRREAFIIVPLEFGKWQEKILKEAADKPGNFKTARLFKKNGGYYLAVSIETGESENIRTSTFMGVSRGIKSSLNYMVVDEEGKILEQGPVFHTEQSRSQGAVFHSEQSRSQGAGNWAVSVRNKPDPVSGLAGISVNELHEAANFIVDKAYLYKARVIVQNLPGRSDRLGWAENGQERVQPEYRQQDYKRLIRLLDYKLPWKCLPKPVKVSSVGIFYSCPECGFHSKSNRLNWDFFICTRCGMAMEIDRLGSLNLARRLIDYNSSKIKITVIRAEEGVNFANRILGLDLFSYYQENQLMELKDEIEGIMKRTEEEGMASNERAQAARSSMVRKLRGAERFMDLIEYI
jgi:putative transposase